MKTLQVGQSGETNHAPTSPRIFERRMISFYELMRPFNLPLLSSLNETINERLATVEVDKDYFMPEITGIRWVYNFVAKLEGYSVADYRCLIPNAVATAKDLLLRDSWSYHLSIWNEHARNPHVPTISLRKDPPPSVHRYPEPVKGYVLMTELKQLKQAFEKDLKENRVFQLDGEEIGFYNGSGEYAFGSIAFERFPTIEKDIIAAGRSFAAAIEDYTACVFHLGRATEIVTQAIATKFGVTPDWPDSNQPKRKAGKKAWGDFIVSLETEIGATLDVTKITDNEVRTHLSHAMVASRKLKKLRNDTDHIYLSLSEFYDKDYALLIWKETKSFIEHSARTF